MKVAWSTTYEELYHDLQKRAAGMYPGLKPNDISGSMWVECWGEMEPIEWENWISRTQHMLGIPGARLRFEFQFDDARERQPLRPRYQGVRRARRHVAGWMRGLLCSSSVEGTTETEWELEVLDDEARSFASQARAGS